MDQWLVRNRMLGGSSNTWTGRCAPFDEIDYEARNWVQYSGWPFTAGELEPFLQRAAPYLGLGLGSGFSDRSFWKLFGRPNFSPEIDEELLVPFFWQFSKDDVNRFDYMRFAKGLLNSASGVRVILNATVTNINIDAGE
jgi:choline dehydrogenase-like flavoprotein